MKKVLLVTVLFLFVVKIYSQDSVIEIEKYRTGIWNEYSNKWNYDDFTYSYGLKVTIHGNLIFMNDKAQSYYTLISDTRKKNIGYTDSNTEYESNSWNAKDNKGLNCLVSLIFYKDDGQVKLSIMYDNLIINYIKKP